MELGSLSEMLSLDLRKFLSMLNPVPLVDHVRDSYILFVGGLVVSDNNTIGGTLPTELGQLKELQFLDLCKNPVQVNATCMLVTRLPNRFILPHLGEFCVYWILT